MELWLKEGEKKICDLLTMSAMGAGLGKDLPF